MTEKFFQFNFFSDLLTPFVQELLAWSFPSKPQRESFELVKENTNLEIEVLNSPTEKGYAKKAMSLPHWYFSIFKIRFL